MAALLLFLICATVGSVVLAAAASSMGRTSSADTDANRQRYSLESASRVIINDLLGDTTAENNGLTVEISQTWYVHLSSANYATITENKATSMEKDYISTDDTISSALLYNTGNYIKDPKTQVTYGDFVLMLDQEKATDTSSYPAYPQLGDNSYSEAYGWDEAYEDGTSTQVSWTKKGSGKSSNALRSTVQENPQSSLQDVLCLMEDEIFRHYWYAINNTTEEKVTKISTTHTRSAPLTSAFDPLNSSPSEDWSQITGRMAGTYSIGTDKNSPLKITPPVVEGVETKIYPVYAQVSLDQDGVLTVHLYCGSRDGTTDTTETVKEDPDQAADSLYLVFEPEQQGPTLHYSVTPTVTTKRDSPIYVQTLSAVTADAVSEEQLKQQYSGQNVILHITNVTNDRSNDTESEGANSAGLNHYTYDVYTQVTPTQTLTHQKRSWTYSITWKNVSISTTDPNAE